MVSEQECELLRQDMMTNMSFEIDPNTTFFDTLGMQDRMKELARQDHASFLALCRTLLTDDNKEVRQGTLLSLSWGIPPDADLAQVLIESSLDDKELLDTALYALARVATHAAFPTLYRYAAEGSAWALSGAGRLAQTEGERQAVLSLARTSVTAPDYRVRAAALTILTRRSTIEREEDVILEAVRLYKDENFIGALREATPAKMLPQLKELAASVPENSTAFEDLSKTIAALEKRREEEL